LQRSQAHAAIREFADTASVGLDGPWRDAVRQASAGRSDDIVPLLDRAVSTAGVATIQTPAWWYMANGLQWLAFIAFIGGLAWWGAVEVAERTKLYQLDSMVVAGYDLPMILAAGGLAAGLALGIVGAIVNRIAARRRARHAERVLRAAIESVADQQVIEPVRRELQAYERYRTNIIRARA